MRKHVDERKCKNCNVVEHELHFLLECSLYNDIRIQYLDSYFYENPNQFKLKKLFQSTQEKQIIDLSIFIYKAFTLRNSVLYICVMYVCIYNVCMHFVYVYGYVRCTIPEGCTLIP